MVGLCIYNCWLWHWMGSLWASLCVALADNVNGKFMPKFSFWRHLATVISISPLQVVGYGKEVAMQPGIRYSFLNRRHFGPSTGREFQPRLPPPACRTHISQVNSKPGRPRSRVLVQTVLGIWSLISGQILSAGYTTSTERCTQRSRTANFAVATGSSTVGLANRH